MKKEGILGGISGGFVTDQELAYNILFPAKDPFRKLQMLTDLQPRTITLLSALGVIRRRFKSDILKWYEEELRYNRIANDRKGRLEAAEVVAASRKAVEDND